MKELYKYIYCLAPLAYSLPQEGVKPPQLPDDTALVASISSAVASASLKPFVQPQPTDEIKEWSALGDSYTAGIGSDAARDWQKDSGDCSRYDKSYPVQMNANAQWPGDSAARKLDFGACTGNLMDDLTGKQLSDHAPNHYKDFGRPQMSVVTIGGNDLGFSTVINSCIIRAWGYPNIQDCNDVLTEMERKVRDQGFFGKLDQTFLAIVSKGRSSGGAKPPESFQVFVNGYVPFWNEDDPGCDTVNWVWYRRNAKDHYLSRQVRKRMNDIVSQLNTAFRQSAYRLRNFGVVYVEGFQDSYKGHQFCDPAVDPNLKNPINDNTWFWATNSPWDTSSASAVSNNNISLSEEIFNALVPDAGQRAAVSSGQQDPSNFSDAFKSQAAFETALAGLGNGTEQTVSLIYERYRRIFHPKGSGYAQHANVNVKSILSARQGKEVAANPDSVSSAALTASSAPPSPSPSQPSDICGDWYKMVLDYFEIRGSNFDPSKFGADGSGLESQIKGCGALTKWHFEYTPHDPRFAWYAHGQLPIGTKACVGRAVVSAGGEGPDGCTGSG